MTALIAVPMLLAAGMAVDYTAASTERAAMQDVADSAALAGASVYDGTNEKAAITAAEGFLKDYKTDLVGKASFDVSMNGQTVEVDFKGESDNAFMDIVGVKSTPIGVVSEAIAPMRPKKIEFTPTKAQGWYYKKVSIIVVRPNTTVETVVGTVTYQPLTQHDGGQGTMEVVPSSSIELGEYTDLILRMEIKNDGCAIKERAEMDGEKINCKTRNRAEDRVYNLTLRTDNPDTSHYLFVDGKQLAKGVTSPLSSILVCGKTSSHAWEDGGGFARQDFFYTAKTTCAPDGRFARLTK
jgi:hypothetical protein